MLIPAIEAYKQAWKPQSDSELDHPNVYSDSSCLQAAAPHMRDAAKKELENGSKPKDRCIINVSSTSGTHGNTGQASAV